MAKTRDTIKFDYTGDCFFCNPTAPDAACTACAGEGYLEDHEIELPAKFEVCPTCRGKGSHVNPAIDGHGISAEEWERDWDDESRENYFSGVYDVPCHECAGLRVVPVVDLDRCNEAAKKAAAAHEKAESERAQWDAEDRHTRRMESGGY